MSRGCTRRAISDRAQELVRAALLVGGAALLHYFGVYHVPFLAVAWLCMAVWVGYIIGRWWAVLLAPGPWVSAFVTGVIFREYDLSGFSILRAVPFAVVPGLLGIAVGVAWRRREQSQAS